jgi:hypothetical protein
MNYRDRMVLNDAIERHLDPEDECRCGQCHLSFVEKYQEKIICTSEQQRYTFKHDGDLDDGENLDFEYLSFSDEDLEILNRIQNENNLSDEEMEQINNLFAPIIKKRDEQENKKSKQQLEKEDREWAQLVCSHPKDSVIVNEAGGVRFKVCKKCKADLGDVK